MFVLYVYFSNNFLEMFTFSKLRDELDELGYTATFTSESAPLVNKLLSDLKITTSNLQKYMKLSQQTLEELNDLELGAEPYKCDNAKLIKECNELHLAFIDFKEKHEEVQIEFKKKIACLEAQLKECQLQKKKLIEDIHKLQILNKSEKKVPKFDKNKHSQVNYVMESAEQKIVCLNNEIKKLKDNQVQIINNNEFLKKQLENRNDEIQRLNSLLEGGRSTKALSRDCCYKKIDNKLGALQDEIKSLNIDKNTLQDQLKEALAKQHEAMRRALHLAERNKQLENEMKNIDQIALQVEAECNSTVRNNAEKVSRLQDRLNESILAIQNLERENVKLKEEKSALYADLDAIKLEKVRLQSALETETADKKRLIDRINSCTIIENDLNMEIERLVRTIGEQKLKIAELESQVVMRQTTVDNKSFPVDSNWKVKESKAQDPVKTNVKVGMMGRAAPSKISAKKLGTKKIEHKKTCKKFTYQEDSAPQDRIPENTVCMKTPKCCCEAGECVKQVTELLKKELEYRQIQANQQIESLKQEKEYFIKEHQKLVEQLRSLSSTNNFERLQRQYDVLLEQIEQKEQVISSLEKEVRILKQKRNLQETTLLNGEKELDSDTGICHKTLCRRKSRELEIHHEEVLHLQKENVLLKDKIQELNKSTVFDQERMKRAFQEMEEHIRKLEDERRDLMVNQCTSRSNLTQLEEEYNLLKQQLKQSQSELSQQKASYTQLKNLHDQTDRALSESQNRLLNTETELQNLQLQLNSSHRDSIGYEREITKLQNDIDIMKKQLTKLDKEKDDLLNSVDEKTEKIDRFEQELKDKKNIISSLQSELKDVKKKLGDIQEERSSQDLLLRSSKQEIDILQNDYETEKKLKESALNETRRLKSDIASLTCDCKAARKELELSKREIDDVKRQLQHYVAEVKRTEDLISQKEIERAEILDQFRCLSEEATILENSNHTLENEATQSRVQLSVALDHAANLERKLEDEKSVIQSYEKQISDLTSQVASMEIQMKQTNSYYDRIESELKQMKELCIKLDQEKDQLRCQLYAKEDQRIDAERNMEKALKESKELKIALNKDQTNLDGLEKLLQEARREVLEQRALNQDLQEEICRMKSKIKELQEKLIATSEQLDLYQEKIFEYSQQNKRLHRAIANERFFKAKEDDNKRYPSL